MVIDNFNSAEEFIENLNNGMDNNETLSFEEYSNLAFSEEVYFGKNNSFRNEMIAAITNLQDSILNLVDAEKSGDPKKNRTIIQKKLDNPLHSSDILKITDEIGNIIARHCNVDKCYFSLTKMENAYTYPVAFDTSLLVRRNSRLKWPILNWITRNDAVKTGKELQKSLMSLEDIKIDKSHGYRFKDPTKKVFVITLGLDFIIGSTKFSNAMSPEDLTGIVFHEIGHNFQQMIVGTNQMILDRYQRQVIFDQFQLITSGYIFGIVIGIISKLLGALDVDNYSRSNRNSNFRQKFVRALIRGNVRIGITGELITQTDIGEKERQNIQLTLNRLRLERGNIFIAMLSFISKILFTLSVTSNRVLQLMYTFMKPLNVAIGALVFADHKDFIRKNKQYEQFADNFAVSYGFAKNVGSAQYYFAHSSGTSKMVHVSDFINYFPIFGTINSITELLIAKLNTAINGYDIGRDRVANAYTALQYELSHNSGLSRTEIEEIHRDMDELNEIFDVFKEKDYKDSAKSILSRLLLKGIKEEDIETKGDNTGLVENVLDTLQEYEETGKLNRKQVDKYMDEVDSEYKTPSNLFKFIVNGIKNSPGMSVSMISSVVKNVTSSFSSIMKAR